MPDSEPFPGGAHSVASERILSELQTLFTQGIIPGGGMVNSFVCVVESFNEDAQSRVQVLWSDNRTTVLLGLLNYGHIMVTQGMGGPSSEE